MTNKEVIERLKVLIDTLEGMISYCKDFEPKNDISRYEQDIECYKMAIAAMEKQEPKERIMPDEDDILDGIEYHCPNCGRAYKKDSRYDYCISCGQHLLWDEECVPMMVYNGGTNK